MSAEGDCHVAPLLAMTARFACGSRLLQLDQGAAEILRMQEQHRLVLGREAVFALMVGPMQRMPGRETAIGGAHVTSRES